MAAPTVSSGEASTISATSAHFAGNVSDDGGATVTERGFVYGLVADPTTSDSKVVVSGTTGAYVGFENGLAPNTTYHFRAFATNSGGTGYGDDVEFSTLASRESLALLSTSRLSRHRLSAERLS